MNFLNQLTSVFNPKTALSPVTTLQAQVGGGRKEAAEKARLLEKRAARPCRRGLARGPRAHSGVVFGEPVRAGGKITPGSASRGKAKAKSRPPRTKPPRPKPRAYSLPRMWPACKNSVREGAVLSFLLTELPCFERKTGFGGCFIATGCVCVCVFSVVCDTG